MMGRNDLKFNFEIVPVYSKQGIYTKTVDTNCYLPYYIV